MKTSSIDVEKPSRLRLARLGAATAALAVILTGLSVPAAQALQPGEWLLESETDLGDFGIPGGIAIDQSNGDYYLTDFSTHELVKFNRAGQELTSRGKEGPGLGNFKSPQGVAVDANGYVYVADAENDLIQKFDENLTYMTQWGGTGSGDGKFKYPYDLAIAPNGDVLVADLKNDRIQRFKSDGTWVNTFGSKGQGIDQLSMPRGLAVSESGTVLVADTGNHRVSAFDAAGNGLGSFGSIGNQPGQFFTPSDIEVDVKGFILVNDVGNSRIQRFDGGGNPVAAWGTPGSAFGFDLDRTTGALHTVVIGSLLQYRAASVPAFATGPNESATVGKPYETHLEASGYPAPAISVVGDSLPKGFVLNGDTISGVKRKTGSYKVTLQADNTVGNPVVKEYSITVGKASSVVKTAWSTKKPKVKKAYSVKVRISAPGTTGLSRTGSVKVYYGSKRVKTVKISKADRGVETVKLPAFTKKGKKKVTVKYFGNSQLKGKSYVTYVYAK